ncbi:TetR/AcrR family transcriptional regulator [Isoptericola sp. NPDC057559]|uniref:TetR/AcrR family transcriptional regulator n=1 Tax=Isoptericola sp. NPDC057559 TaxID=3346168 RepID=UPI003699D9E6
MTDARPPGLRERKRAAARARVEAAAVDLCLEHGYAAVTVARICAASGVAQSTFFKYFGSKDAAILGRPPHPSEDAVEAFVGADGPLLDDLVALLVTGAREAVGDLDLFRRRFQLLEGDARLRSREIGHLAGPRSWAVTAARRRLERTSRLPAPDLDARAHLAVVLASGLLRHTLWSLPVVPGAPWDEALRRSLALAGSLLAEGRPAVRRGPPTASPVVRGRRRP